MKIAVYAGVHGTEQDRLLKALVRNASVLQPHNVAAPPPGRYRELLSDTLTQLHGAQPVPGARDVLLDSILEEDPDQVRRLVLCHENLLGAARTMFLGGRIYDQAEFRLRSLHALFDEDQIELFIGLRNPALLLPDLLSRVPQSSVNEFLSGVNPAHLLWSDFLLRLRHALPQTPITVWCAEDTPLLWGEVIRALSGLPSGTKITGAFDVLATIMEPEGMRRFRAYLSQHPAISEDHKRRVMMAFLDKYAMEEALEDSIDQPGWDDAYVAGLTARYDADLQTIAAIPGVTLLAT